LTFTRGRSVTGSRSTDGFTGRNHVEKYTLRRFVDAYPTTAENLLYVPRHYKHYNQLKQGACVGFAWSWSQSINNRKKYDAFWLYRECKKRDGYPNEEGTFIYVAGDVLRERGHKRLYRSREYEPDLDQGIERFEWATTVDDIRAALAAGIPVTLGINWYSSFDYPEKIGNVWVIGADTNNLGSVRGGHAICLTGVSDRKHAVRFVNSWGEEYPPNTWIPYETLERLLNEKGEAAITVDRWLS